MNDIKPEKCLIENIGQPSLVPVPYSFFKTWWFKRCCHNKAMLRMRLVQKQRCSRCNKVMEQVLQDDIAFCPCCNKYIEVLRPD